MAPRQTDTDAATTNRLTGTHPLTPDAHVHEARARLRNTGEPAAVVFRSGRPVGVVTADALASTYDANALIVRVMDHATVSVNPRADAIDTERAFSRAAQDWLSRRPTT